MTSWYSSTCSCMLWVRFTLASPNSSRSSYSNCLIFLCYPSGMFSSSIEAAFGDSTNKWACVTPLFSIAETSTLKPVRVVRSSSLCWRSIFVSKLVTFSSSTYFRLGASCLRKYLKTASSYSPTVTSLKLLKLPQKCTKARDASLSDVNGFDSNLSILTEDCFNCAKKSTRASLFYERLSSATENWDNGSV